MSSILPRMAAAVLMLGAVSLAACSESDVDTEQAKDQAQSAAQTARDSSAGQQAQAAAGTVQKEVKEAWSSVSVDSDRLLDRIQARNDPEAKTELLNKCRDAQEKIAKSDSARGGDVNKLCDQIRDTDVNNRDSWNQIKDQMTRLNQQLGS